MTGLSRPSKSHKLADRCVCHPHGKTASAPRMSFKVFAFSCPWSSKLLIYTPVSVTADERTVLDPFQPFVPAAFNGIRRLPNGR